jgi:hypothetical protein
MLKRDSFESSTSRVLRSLVLAAAVAYAGAASATSVWYADVKTSSSLGNVHGEISSLTDLGNIPALVASVDLDIVGSGLGTALVTTSAPLPIVHTFAPDGYTLNHVVHASVVVSVVDDLDWGSEIGQIVVDGSVLDSGQASFSLFDGSVTALIDAIGDSITVNVQSTRGDFRVLFSALSVHFDGTPIRVAGPPTPAVPEPTAALLFAAGALVVRRGVRRS